MTYEELALIQALRRALLAIADELGEGSLGCAVWDTSQLSNELMLKLAQAVLNAGKEEA